MPVDSQTVAVATSPMWVGTEASQDCREQMVGAPGGAPGGKGPARRGCVRAHCGMWRMRTREVGVGAA